MGVMQGRWVPVLLGKLPDEQCFYILRVSSLHRVVGTAGFEERSERTNNRLFVRSMAFVVLLHTLMAVGWPSGQVLGNPDVDNLTG